MPDVLVCGPDHDLAESWAQLMDGNGRSAEVVEVGRQDVRKLLSASFKAAIVGVSATDEESLEVISVAHEVNPHLPVVAIADGESLELERQVRMRKIFYYLIQPVDAEELSAVVDRALGQ